MERIDLYNLADSRVVSMDIIDTLCGDKIGRGMSREVYECRIDPSYVVKIEIEAGSFQNIIEHGFWHDNSDNKLVSKWLAPCGWISANGAVLLQKKVSPIRKEELPKKVPEFLTDIQLKNYGILNGKFVCFDYGLTIPRVSLKLKKATWD